MRTSFLQFNEPTNVISPFYGNHKFMTTTKKWTFSKKYRIHSKTLKSLSKSFIDAKEKYFFSVDVESVDDTSSLLLLHYNSLQGVINILYCSSLFCYSLAFFGLSGCLISLPKIYSFTKKEKKFFSVSLCWCNFNDVVKRAFDGILYVLGVFR